MGKRVKNIAQHRIIFFSSLVVACGVGAGISAGLIAAQTPFTYTLFFAAFLPAITVGGGAGFAVYHFFLRPIQELQDRMHAVSQEPELILPPVQTQSLEALQHVHLQLEKLFQTIRKTLRQQQRLADVGQAVAKINHDVRNSLSVATLLADQLETSADPNTAKAGTLIVSSTKMAADMCQNMLDYLAEMPSPDYTEIDMPSFIEAFEASYPMTLGYSGPAHIICDRLFLSRILTNLLRNAVIAQATHMQVDIWSAGHLLVIDFSDNGPGIEPARKADLFAPFAASSRAGSGLGLFICLDLALALGGKFFLSRSNEAGSEFRLQLPAIPAYLPKV